MKHFFVCVLNLTWVQIMSTAIQHCFWTFLISTYVNIGFSELYFCPKKLYAETLILVVDFLSLLEVIKWPDRGLFANADK